MPVEYSVESEDISRQIDKLRRYDGLYTKHITKAQSANVQQVHKRWWFIAPIDRGLYRRTLKKEVKRFVGGEIVGIVGTDAMSKGFPYPAALEQSPRYHYRSTGKKGQRTMGQVKKMLKKAGRRIDLEFRKAINRITKDLEVR